MKLPSVICAISGLLLFSHLVMAAETEKPTQTSSQVTASNETDAKQAFHERLIKALGKFPKKWDRIEMLDGGKTDVRTALYYREDATLTSYDEVAQDTKSVVRAILKILMEDGFDPSKEYYFIVTHAYQPAGAGETGKSLTRKLGKSSYDRESDQIKYRDPTKY
jgi:hypothetical protein